MTLQSLAHNTSVLQAAPHAGQAWEAPPAQLLALWGAALPTQCCVGSSTLTRTFLAVQAWPAPGGDSADTQLVAFMGLLHAHSCLTHLSLALQARMHLAEGDGAVALQSLAHLMARVQQAAPHTEQHTEAQQHALRLQESDVSVLQALQLSCTV